MVYSLYHQISCACITVNFSEFCRVKFGWVPVAQYFFVAGHRRMTVFFKMVIIGAFAWFVKIACIPVAAFTGRLRTEMNPYTKFGITKPCRRTRIILFDGFPCGLKRSGGQWNIQFHFRKRFPVAHLHTVNRLWRWHYWHWIVCLRLQAVSNQCKSDQ